MYDAVNQNSYKESIRTQRVLITGGASGIGAAITKKFILSGARVAIVDIDARAIDTKAGILSSAEIILLGDVSDPSSMDEVFGELDRCFGGIDVVINNAGISIPASLADTSLEVWNRVLSVNLTGMFLVSQRAPIYCPNSPSNINKST